MKLDRSLRVIVCGGREFDDQPWMDSVLDIWAAVFGTGNLTLIQGGGRGADAQAANWAKRNGVRCRTFKADWARYGAKAGPFRNADMLAVGKPDFVLAFPGGPGTADMVERARKAGVLVAEARHG